MVILFETSLLTFKELKSLLSILKSQIFIVIGYIVAFKGDLIIIIVAAELLIIGAIIFLIIIVAYFGILIGEIFVLLALVIAAAETAVLLAVIVSYFQLTFIKYLNPIV